MKKIIKQSYGFLMGIAIFGLLLQSTLQGWAEMCPKLMCNLIFFIPLFICVCTFSFSVGFVYFDYFMKENDEK